MSHGASLDIEAFIDQSPFSPFQWLLLLLCFLVIFMDGYDMAAIAYVAPSLLDEWGVQKAELGPAMSAALFGLAFGSLLSGPLADRVGRKPAVIYSVLLFGVFSLATAWSTSIGSLTLLRFITGLGLGAAMPNSITLLSEYCPSKRRTMIVSAMLCGFPLGAAVGGLLAGYLIPSFGWRSVLVVGGVVPILLCVALPWLLPESVRYMVLKRYPSARIRAVLQRIKKEGTERAEHFVIAEKIADGHSAIRAILTSPHRTVTGLLWLSCFMSMLVFYMIVSWMPLLLKEAGLSVLQFSHISALFPLGGGVGSIVIGWVMDRREPNKVLALTYLAAGVLAYGVGLAVGNVTHTLLLGSLVFFMGFASGGGQSALASLSASYYPTSCRATGVGSMYGVGRFGAIFGVLAGAELLRYQYPAAAIFSLLLIPAWLVCLTLMLKYFSGRRRELLLARLPDKQ
ncbi:MFS transporter [Serratia liquefaciens]|uniref:MFS transporter n=1 Tax=Serratia liquefaciens TaxID=614 RepID=UPI0021790EE3|nr:MFS transporter [Serratia liquefaciens]CAI0859967.1 4-hydroxybenzoate transporter PcaK [Serratia liquefaciens]